MNNKFKIFLSGGITGLNTKECKKMERLFTKSVSWCLWFKYYYNCKSNASF